ncbi:aldo/keto reductase [Methanohalophilus sp.]|uniref:aldo/keto reductase n=1 Tax=Methanohalophilus sp. TaxID=1966352 RepID=UPI002635008B|nr:aldo/keto reductase [Methanohalophilus sp.]MDK2892035.1 uncharacterized protein [Methanohalophilus sp.]
MLYRTLGKTGEKVSILGLGCMRLPVIGDDPSRIDEIAAEEIVRYAIDSGINYFDTAYPYHEGKSESFLGKVLNDIDRKKVFLVTKMPSWLIESRKEMDTYFEEQLEKLHTNFVDAYLVHTLNSDFWKSLTELGLFEFLDTIKEKGKARYVGFSFHDNVELFKEIVDAYPWDICQIQYNYLDVDYQAGKEGLLYAAEKGLGIVIMEPLRGGCLAENVPPEIMDIWNKNPVRRTPAEWGLRFLWDYPEINIVLSGMTTLDQLKENIQTAENGHAKSLTDFEHELISKVRNIYREKLKVNCTGCRYCLPCPAGVNISLNFKYLNNAMLFGDIEKARLDYMNHVGDDRKASNCIKCGRCSERCPQDIPIPEMLEEIVKLLESE